MWDELFSKNNEPSMEDISKYIDNGLWEEFNKRIQDDFNVKPVTAYSGCSLQPGWNVKYKKSSKSLCTLYPMKGYFIALVVIGKAEEERTLAMIDECSEYTKDLYYRTEGGNNQKWLMIEIKNGEILEDALVLIRIRSSKK